MHKTRKHIAVFAMVASLSVLAACSNEEEAAPVNQTPPVTTPAPSTPPPPVTPAPDTSTPSTSGSMSTPSTTPGTDPSTSTGDSSSSTGGSLSGTANALKDNAIEAAGKVGDAIKQGAASADAAIQSKLGNEPKPAITN